MSVEYENFLKAAKNLADLGHAQALLSWDQETYMPPKGTAQRASSLGTLAGIHHAQLTDDAFVQTVKALKDAELKGDEAINVQEIARIQERALKIPTELVVELNETQSLAHEAWIKAREDSDFGHFAPWLEKVLGLQKEIAERVGYEGSIYNAFLDEYEPHTRAEDVAPVLHALKDRLVPLAERIGATGKKPAAGILDQDFSIDQQEAFGRRVMADLGFDLEAGRLDIAVHPFCSGLSRSDVRLTTRYSVDKMEESLFGIIHETGHGLYEQGLPEDAAGLPLCSSISLGIHESQSRLWENMVGRGRPFWTYYLPILKEHFPGQLDGVDLEAFYAAVNQVEPSFIRVEADEVTYNLHILLRFELEQALVEDRVSIADLPELWNARMEEYLGLKPENAAQGVLQDVHWSFGLIGYFPTYSLGNLYAAQFFQQAQKDMPGLDDDLAAGRLAGLKGWLNEKVHRRGRRVNAGELVREVTGEELSADYFMDYLEGKFGDLYGV